MAGQEANPAGVKSRGWGSPEGYRERAQPVIQLRCIDVNGQWETFVSWVLKRMQTETRQQGRRARLQTQSPAKLPYQRKVA